MELVALCWLVGFVLTAALTRHVNGGLSVLDFAACAFVATIWPLTAVIALIVAMVYKAPWLTEARYLRRK